MKPVSAIEGMTKWPGDFWIGAVILTILFVLIAVLFVCDERRRSFAALMAIFVGCLGAWVFSNPGNDQRRAIREFELRQQAGRYGVISKIEFNNSYVNMVKVGYKDGKQRLIIDGKSYVLER